MKVLLLLPLFAVLLVAGCVGQTINANDQIDESQLPLPPPPPTDQGEGGTTEEPPESLPLEATVEMSESGFSPSTLTVAAGTEVHFENVGSSDHWPASAVHPTHTAYPEGGGCIGSAFDACEGIPPGGDWHFVFNEAGTWRYHDHLNPSLTGTVVVE
ncbi:MAG: hypothetical protein HYW25_04105 [Candidatus Aenigmarchaeota archaeon]|nr:hypothetical protein [Candidatus Aenigmarchaeota archaeon]